MKAELILASASPRRQELLRQIGLSFSVYPSSFVENGDGSLSALDMAIRNAVGKARQVAKEHESGFVLGADTVVVYQDQVLGKPRDRADARRMLQLLSGRWHQVITAVALVDAPSGRLMQDAISTRVHMRRLTPDEIEDYLDSAEPYDKAGAYGIQGRAGQFVDRIEGCYFTVVGLPLSRVVEMIQAMHHEAKTR
jgi:septum formation protein